jgi:hypothetical protein
VGTCFPPLKGGGDKIFLETYSAKFPKTPQKKIESNTNEFLYLE